MMWVFEGIKLGKWTKRKTFANRTPSSHFRRFNLSLVSCSPAELISVSIEQANFNSINYIYKLSKKATTYQYKKLIDYCFSCILNDKYQANETYFESHPNLDKNPHILRPNTRFGSPGITCPLYIEFLNLYRNNSTVRIMVRKDKKIEIRSFSS